MITLQLQAVFESSLGVMSMLQQVINPATERLVKRLSAAPAPFCTRLTNRRDASALYPSSELHGAWNHAACRLVHIITPATGCDGHDF
jgi:hypothetical protein